MASSVVLGRDCNADVSPDMTRLARAVASPSDMPVATRRAVSSADSISVVVLPESG